MIVIVMMLMLIVVMVVVMLVLFVIMGVVMLMLIMVMVVVMFMLIMVVIIVLVHIGVELTNPRGGVGYLVKIKVVCVEYLLEIHLAANSLDDLSLRLERPDHLFDVDELFVGDKIHLVEDDGVAELDLLDQQILDILIVDIILQQSAAAAEL